MDYPTRFLKYVDAEPIGGLREIVHNLLSIISATFIKKMTWSRSYEFIRRTTPIFTDLSAKSSFSKLDVLPLTRMETLNVIWGR